MNIVKAIALVVLSTLSVCTSFGTDAAREKSFVETFGGTYQGSFGGALTEDPSDDLNYNPCDSSRQRCLSTDAYLAGDSVALGHRLRPRGRGKSRSNRSWG